MFTRGLTEVQERAFEAVERARQELSTLAFLVERRTGELAAVDAELCRGLQAVELLLDQLRMLLGVEEFGELAVRAYPEPVEREEVGP